VYNEPHFFHAMRGNSANPRGTGAAAELEFSTAAAAGGADAGRFDPRL
jgi:hypothetical protein